MFRLSKKEEGYIEGFIEGFIGRKDLRIPPTIETPVEGKKDRLKSVSIVGFFEGGMRRENQARSGRDGKKLKINKEVCMMTCPVCGKECDAEFVDNGVGLQQCGPYQCVPSEGGCGWVQIDILGDGYEA